MTPNLLPATNIHVLIGRDGVGWTRCFDFLARAFLGMPADDLTQPVGELRNRAANPWGIEDLNADPGFAGLITVSFGAFDSTGPLAVSAVATSVTPMSGWSRTGPRRPARQVAMPRGPRVKDGHEFAKSMLGCREGVRRRR